MTDHDDVTLVDIKRLLDDADANLEWAQNALTERRRLYREALEERVAPIAVYFRQLLELRGIPVSSPLHDLLKTLEEKAQP